MIYILLVIIILCSWLGWFCEIMYRKHLIKQIFKKFNGKLNWLEKSNGEHFVEIETWKEAIKIIKKLVGEDSSRLGGVNAKQKTNQKRDSRIEHDNYSNQPNSKHTTNKNI